MENELFCKRHVGLLCVYLQQAMLELEANPDIKPILREVYFSSAKVSPASHQLSLCCCHMLMNTNDLALVVM